MNHAKKVNPFCHIVCHNTTEKQLITFYFECLVNLKINNKLNKFDPIDRGTETVKYHPSLALVRCIFKVMCQNDIACQQFCPLIRIRIK